MQIMSTICRDNRPHYSSKPNIGKITMHKKDMIECVLKLHFNTCKEIWVKLNKEHWFEHVPKSVETSN
jgi:hypothetical protein